MRTINFHYGEGSGSTITNNGHTLVVTPAGGNSVEIGGETYRLAQFHFHTPSEHMDNGRHSPMEMHLVHVDAAGNPKVVVGIFIDGLLEESDTPGSQNDPRASRVLDGLVLPAHKDDTRAVDGTINLMDLLPIYFGRHRGEHIEYKGSLTTPGCTEGLTWVVMAYKLHTPPEVVARFHKIMGDNYRNTKPMHGRKIRCCGGGSSAVFNEN